MLQCKQTRCATYHNCEARRYRNIEADFALNAIGKKKKFQGSYPTLPAGTICSTKISLIGLIDVLIDSILHLLSAMYTTHGDICSVTTDPYYYIYCYILQSEDIKSSATYPKIIRYVSIRTEALSNYTSERGK